MSKFLQDIYDEYYDDESEFGEEIYHIAASTLNEVANICDSTERIIKEKLIAKGDKQMTQIEKVKKIIENGKKMTHKELKKREKDICYEMGCDVDFEEKCPCFEICDSDNNEKVARQYTILLAAYDYLLKNITGV